MNDQRPSSILLNKNDKNIHDVEGGYRADSSESLSEQDGCECYDNGKASSDATQLFQNCDAVCDAFLQDAIPRDGVLGESLPIRPSLDGDGILLHSTNSSSSFGPQAFQPFNDRYRIGEEIGTGGMGLVHLGWDTQLQRHVAIKIIRGDQRGEQLLHRFLREARIASRLSHPGILGIHDFGYEPSVSAYIIMDLITGRTLEDAITEAVHCEAKRQSLLTAFFQICQAMAYAHANGVVHRDLKPANIMVGDYGLATVLDWGLAKVIGNCDLESKDLQEEPFGPIARPIAVQPSSNSQESFNTLCGTIMGTPHYLAPEQARGEVVDFRSDVFSLGGILCHLLTGSPPFVGKNVSDVYQQSFSGDLTHAYERLDRCGASISLVQLAKRCLDPIAASRPENATVLVEDLKKYLESGQRRAEEELVRFFDLSLDLFCIANTSGYFWRLNNNFSRTLGYTSDELTAIPFIEFVHPDDRPDTLTEIVKLAKGESTIQFVNRYRHKDGHYISLEWTARSLQEEGVIYAVARDITERIRLENERCRLESDRFRLSEIVGSASDAIVGKDLQGIVQSWNLGAERLFGYTAEEMIGKHIHQIIPPEYLEEENTILEKVGRGERVESVETIRFHKCGERIDISLSISPIRDSFGTVIGASKIARSITKQRKLESELEKSRRTLIEFAENANVPLHCVDQFGTIVWANNAELSFLGYHREEYVGQPIAKFHASQEAIADIFSHLLQGRALSHYPAKLVAKDGSIKDVAIYSSAYHEDGKMIHTRCFTFDLKLLRFDNSNAAEPSRSN